jgi:hypothetical protein
MKVSQNFILQEFVPKPIFDRFGNQAIRFVDPQLIDIAQFLRNRYGKPMHANNWHRSTSERFWEDSFSLRGYRPPISGLMNHIETEKGELTALGLTDYEVYCAEIGSYYSDHKIGKALDFTVSGMTPDEIRSDILDNQELMLSKGLTVIEDKRFAPTWVHIANRNVNIDKILIVKPR